ncbi:hypothetical protein BDR06DRAFT_1038034, partial [Suillus hirtellus]
INITDSNIDRIIMVLSHSHAQSTRETYGSSLLVFHVFCDTRAIPEEQRCPASSVLILAFIAACSGLYSGKSLENYFYAVRAWHLLHGQPWYADSDQCTLAMAGGRQLVPITSKRPKHTPFTIDILVAIHSTLDLSSPLHTAVYACLTTSFFTIAHVGEFTVPSLHRFDPQRHIKVSDWRYDADRHGFHVTIFHLPRTKTSLLGEDVYWAAQSGLSDPDAALSNHLSVNQPPPNAALFSWKHHAGLHPLMRSEFLKCLQSSSEKLGLGSLKAHGLCIGGTLEYLLRRVPFENVKMMGRWSSDAFVLYLWKHALVMAPFLQDKPVLELFMRYTLPPPL